MKTSDALTIIIAIYGAFLSTVTSIRQIIEKRRRLAITFTTTYSSGPGGRPAERLLNLRAANLGENKIALKTFWINTIPMRGTKPLGPLRRKLVGLYGITFSEMIVWPDTIVKNDPAFPLDVEPGKSCELAVDLNQLVPKIKRPNIKKRHVVAVFSDQIGREYKSGELIIDLENGDVDQYYAWYLRKILELMLWWGKRSGRGGTLPWV